MNVYLQKRPLSVGKFPQSFGTRCDPTTHTFGNFESQPSCSSTGRPIIQGEKVEYTGAPQKSPEECESYFILKLREDGTAELHPVESWSSYSSRPKMLRPHVAKIQTNDNAEEVIKSRRTVFIEEENKARQMNKRPRDAAQDTATGGDKDDAGMRNEVLGEDMGFSREEKRRKKGIQRAHGREDDDAKEAAEGASGMLELNHLDDADWNQEFSDDEGFLDKSGQNGDDLLEEKEINAGIQGEVPMEMLESDDEREKVLDSHGQEIEALLKKPINVNDRLVALDSELNELRAETQMEAGTGPTEETDVLEDLCERTLALLGAQGGKMALRDLLKHFGVKASDANEAAAESSLRQSLLKTLKSLKKQKKVVFQERPETKGGTLIRLRA
eukprot:GEMP01037214.1.p1 GENE.GEMP01037214.1~~GEMP01037214.1.p1  ORF type:complete len:410 (-),score=112.01 GEMP01037214.1:766-1923(-)